MNDKVATCKACKQDILNGEDWHWRPLTHEPVHEKCEPRVPGRVGDVDPRHFRSNRFRVEEFD